MAFSGFNPNPVEQATAVTDLILGIQCVWMSRIVWNRGAAEPMRRNLWSAMLVLVALASGIGAFAHGVIISRDTDWLLFRAIYLLLGLSVGLFVCGLVLDVSPHERRDRVTMRTFYAMVVCSFLFFSATVVFPWGFKAFLLYQAVAVMAALAGYGYLSFRKRFPGGRWIMVALLLNTVGALIQATRTLHWVFIWEFDFNGIYHLIQMPAFACLCVGVVRGFDSANDKGTETDEPSPASGKSM